MVNRQSLRTALLAALCLLLGSTLATAGEKIFELKDPVGDDHGDGSLFYPRTSDDFQPGELDLVAFAAEAVGGGTEFVATFRRPVRAPTRRPIDEGGTQLTTVARNGFYTFNVDIYIDTDRKPGSGRITTLPGRKAEIDPANAWEKVVCLTPQPDAARSLLRRILSWSARKELKAQKGRLSENDSNDIANQVDLELARDYFFPSRVNVAGSKIRFFVPNSFLGGPAQATWSYVVAVTAADINASVQLAQASDDSFLQTRGGNLMNLPVVARGAVEALGTSKPDADLMPPIVDIIVPPGVTQEAVLNDWDVLADKRVRLPGVVPAVVATTPAKK